jgi:hypothetical protein
VVVLVVVEAVEMVVYSTKVRVLPQLETVLEAVLVFLVLVETILQVVLVQQELLSFDT